MVLSPLKLWRHPTDRPSWHGYSGQTLFVEPWFCVIEISPRNTGTMFADCPAVMLAVLAPECFSPCLAGRGRCVVSIDSLAAADTSLLASIVSRADNNSIVGLPLYYRHLRVGHLIYREPMYPGDGDLQTRWSRTGYWLDPIRFQVLDVDMVCWSAPANIFATKADRCIMLLQLCFTQRQAACIDSLVQRVIYSCIGSKHLLERRIAKSIKWTTSSNFRAEQSCLKVAISPGTSSGL